MADLALFLTKDNSRPVTTYQNGDIVMADSDRGRSAKLLRARWSDHAVRAPSGEWQGGGIHQQILECFHQTKYTVQGDTVLVEPSGGISYVVGSTPVENPNTGGLEHMHVAEFLARRRASGKKLMTDGSDVWWYGKELNEPEQSAMDVVWSAIGEPAPDRWPFSTLELQHFFALKLPDFVVYSATQLSESEYEDESLYMNPDGSHKLNPDGSHKRPKLLKKRKRWIDFVSIPGVTQGRLNKLFNRDDAVDYRDVLDGFVDELIAQEKI